jgi:hypothetical protein
MRLAPVAFVLGVDLAVCAPPRHPVRGAERRLHVSLLEIWTLLKIWMAIDLVEKQHQRFERVRDQGAHRWREDDETGLRLAHRREWPIHLSVPATWELKSSDTRTAAISSPYG